MTTVKQTHAQTAVGPRPRARPGPGRTVSIGALVIGADYRALGVVRSLGRRGIPTWVLRHGDDLLAATSRYSSRSVVLPHGDGPRLELLERLAGSGLAGWIVFPSGDDTAAFVARHHARLESLFRLTTPTWDTLRWAHDKRLTNSLAARCGVPHARTLYPADRAALAAADLEFPLILKPAAKNGANRLVTAKAWRADTREELLVLYDEACALLPRELLMVQELIPGGGGQQLSYAALCDDGEPLASVVALRARQYPMDFGRASTYVKTVVDVEVEALAGTLLGELGYTGLVEVEFKRDPRDGSCKLLDVNPRVWGWHTLCTRAGVDIPYLAWRMAQGLDVPRVRGEPGVSWMRLSTDLPTAVKEILARRLPLREYLGSMRGPRVSAIFAPDDPVPGILELPLLALVAGRRLLRGSAL